MRSIQSSNVGAGQRLLSPIWQSGPKFSVKVQGSPHGYGAHEKKKKGSLVLLVHCGRGHKIPQKQLTVDPVQALLEALALEDTNHYAALEFHSKSMKAPEWFALFEELSKKDKWLLILEVFRWMQEQRWYRPDDGFYSKIISILGKKGQLRRATWLFREMKKHGCHPDSSVFNAIINAHIRNDNDKGLALTKALMYYEKMNSTDDTKPNKVTYNILLRACAQAKQLQKIEELFKEMELRGFQPDIFTFNGILDAHGKVGAFEAMDSTLKKMRQWKVKADFITYNTMIDSYGKAGKVDKMEEALKNMAMANIKPQLSTLNTLLNIYGGANCVGQMELVLKNMSELGIRPTRITYEILIKGYGNSKCFDKMQKCLEAMGDAGIRPEITTLNAIMEAYSKSGSFKEAENLLDNNVVVPTPLTYRILYKAYLKHGLDGKADTLLKRMDAAGLMPDKKFLLDTMESTTQEFSPKSMKNVVKFKKISKDTVDSTKVNKRGVRKSYLPTKVGKDDFESAVRFRLNSRKAIVTIVN